MQSFCCCFPFSSFLTPFAARSQIAKYNIYNTLYTFKTVSCLFFVTKFDFVGNFSKPEFEFSQKIDWKSQKKNEKFKVKKNENKGNSIENSWNICSRKLNFKTKNGSFVHYVRGSPLDTLLMWLLHCRAVFLSLMGKVYIHVESPKKKSSSKI